MPNSGAMLVGGGILALLSLAGLAVYKSRRPSSGGSATNMMSSLASSMSGSMTSTPSMPKAPPCGCNKG